MKKKEEIDMQQPMMVSSHDVRVSSNHTRWMLELTRPSVLKFSRL